MTDDIEPPYLGTMHRLYNELFLPDLDYKALGPGFGASVIEVNPYLVVEFNPRSYERLYTLASITEHDTVQRWLRNEYGERETLERIKPGLVDFMSYCKLCPACLS